MRPSSIGTWGRRISSRTSRPPSREPARFGRHELRHDRRHRRLDDLRLDQLLVFLLLAFAARRFQPVELEDIAQLPRHGAVGDHDADLAALIELGPPQTLATDESARAVADDRPGMEAQRFERAHVDPVARAFELADDTHIDAGRGLLLQQLDEIRILDVDVVDEQLPSGALDERGQRFTRRLRADDERRAFRRERLTSTVGLEERECLADRMLVLGRHAKAPALCGVSRGAVEREQVQHLVGNHELAVVAHELVARPRHHDAAFEHALFELAQPVLSTAIGVRDQNAHADAAQHCGSERLFDLVTIDAEDRNVDRLGRALDRLHHRREAGLGLDDQIHSSSSSFSRGRAFFSSFHSICVFSSLGASAASAADKSSVLTDAPAFTKYTSSSSPVVRSSNTVFARCRMRSTAGRLSEVPAPSFTVSWNVRTCVSKPSMIDRVSTRKLVPTAAIPKRPTPAANPTARADNMTTASLGSSILAR